MSLLMTSLLSHLNKNLLLNVTKSFHLLICNLFLPWLHTRTFWISLMNHKIKLILKQKWKIIKKMSCWSLLTKWPRTCKFMTNHLLLQHLPHLPFVPREENLEKIMIHNLAENIINDDHLLGKNYPSNVNIQGVL